MRDSRPQAVHPLTARLTERQHRWRSALTSGPAVVWLLGFMLLPLALIVGISFLSRGEYGGAGLPATAENYRRLAGYGMFGFDPLYPRIFLRSVAMGLSTAALCVLAGLPLAFFIAGLPGRWKNTALTLVVIPFWTSLLIRTYAWQIILGPDSPLSRIAAAIGFIGAGDGLYPSLAAVMAGMVCDFLPFLVLPLYASVEKIDWSLAEAAMDLGAHGWNVFRHAVLPQIRPGLLAGFILVFLPATGQFVIPDLLGGGKTAMLGNVIEQQFHQSHDWPFGAAIACAALALVMIGLMIHARWSADREEYL